MRILAHRGAPGTSSTENTVSAVSRALAAGADGVEVDLRLTADGVLAVCHDPDLLRVAGRAVAVAGTPWEVLREAAEPAGVALARVEWVLAAAAGRRVVLELKAAPRSPVGALVERLDGLADAGLPLDVVVSSFDASLAREARRLLPAGVRTALLGRPGRPVLATSRRAVVDGHDEVHPHVADLLRDPLAVESAHAVGLAVVPWTANDRDDLRRLADLDVDAVITDVPVAARSALAFTSRLPSARGSDGSRSRRAPNLSR